MKNTFTEEDLILFIYDEANPNLEAEINAALISDKKLHAKHQYLLAQINQLEDPELLPHETSLKIIMEESALSEREEIF